MRLTAPALLSLTLFVFTSCSDSVRTAERRPIPPKGSDDSYMPWNTPRAGEGAGGFGGLLEGR